MSNQRQWIDRRFDMKHPPESHPELIERLRGTPLRLAERVGGLPDDLLTRRNGESWSIQEHAGHLIQVEALFRGRLDDYAAGVEVLRPAEMSGQSTFAARYNHREIGDILADLHYVRADLIACLESWTPAGFSRVAHHPRLDQPMAVCDMLFFLAEHDDHHLARITALRERG